MCLALLQCLCKCKDTHYILYTQKNILFFSFSKPTNSRSPQTIFTGRNHANASSRQFYAPPKSPRRTTTDLSGTTTMD